MCNRARLSFEPETLHARFGASWAADAARPSRDPVELAPRGLDYVVREEAGRRVLDVMSWDVLGGHAKWPMTNVRDVALPQWRRLAEKPANRCLVPLTEFFEWTPDAHDVGGGKTIEGEIWFAVTDQPIFAVAGFWQPTAKGSGFTMVTCDPNELVAPVHPKAMVTILHQADWSAWLSCPLDDVVGYQKRYPAALMTSRGPVFPTRRAEV